MAERQTRNVSLPPEQDAFVESLVSEGRYRTASEVVRDGLRLLQEAEHRRLLEKWIYDGLSVQDEERLPVEIREKARTYFRALIDDAARNANSGATTDGPSAMDRLRKKLEADLD